MRLETRHLEVLLAIDECGSIRGAARRLGVDQPHVSRQLRRIEQRLATTVFLRSTVGVTATTSGLRVLNLARRAMGVLDEIDRPADPEPGRSAPESLSVLYHGIPATAILDGLAAEYPAIQTQFGSAPPPDAFAELRTGRADVFLGAWLPYVSWPDAESIAVVDVLADPTHVLLAAHHPLAAQPELRLSQLADEPWIVGTDDDSRAAVTQECRLLGGFEPRLAHRVGDESTATILLSHGRGVMLGSSVGPRTRGVVRRSYRGASATRWMLAYVPGRVDRDLVATVSELLREEHRIRSGGPHARVALDAPRAS